MSHAIISSENSLNFVSAARARLANYLRLMLVFLLVLVQSENLWGQEDLKDKKLDRPSLGLSLDVPDESWKLYDRSQGSIKVLVLSPNSNLRKRCTVMAFPNSVIQDGLLTRESSIKAAFKDYQRVAFEQAKLANQDCQRLEFTAIKTRTIEWGFRDRGHFIIFQLSAPEETWQDKESRDSLESIRDSLKYSGHKLDVTPRDVSALSAAQVRAKRQPKDSNQPPTYDVTHHELKVTINPSTKSLNCIDKLTIKSLTDKLESITLYTSLVEIDELKGPGSTTWETKRRSPRNTIDLASVLTVNFDPPIENNVQFELEVKTSSDDYFQAVDQQLVAEVAVVGQIREPSSYSSHVVYYPVDAVNDATANLELVVPDGYTAVTGGQLTSQTTKDGWSSFRYENKVRRKRLLPFGFAVGKYIQKTGISNSGLRITVYAFDGEQELVDQRVEVAVETVNLFEKMMGPLPWPDVHIAHVTPVRKETGVSMPGLIVISDGYFQDFATTDLSDGNLSRADVLSLLVIADELSHQWNIYAAPLSNELGEGISTFTNLLFVENRHGRKSFDLGIQTCVEAYRQSQAIGKEFAIADPAIYSTPAYRGIVFCKTPAVLASLRDMVGDETFFAAWRKAFNSFDADLDGFEIVQRAFSDAAGEDLTWFFDQWFFQAGHPELAVEHEQKGNTLHVTIRQIQTSGLYRLQGTIVLKLKAPNGDTDLIEQSVKISKPETKLEIDVPNKVTEVEFKSPNPLVSVSK